MTETKKHEGHPRTGSLYWTKSGWRARLTIDMDGVEIRKSFDLETTDKRVASPQATRAGCLVRHFGNVGARCLFSLTRSSFHAAWQRRTIVARM